MKLVPVSLTKYNDYGQWLFRTKDASFFIMGNHKYACHCWMLADEAGKNLKEAVLLHVDAHFDYAVDSMLNGFFLNPTVAASLKLACYGLPPKFLPPEYRIMHDNFVPAAVGVGLFESGIFVCRENMHYLPKPVNGMIFPHSIFWTFENFKNFAVSEDFKKRRVCLSLDLDYFNDTNHMRDIKLWDEASIFNCLVFLKNLPNLEVTSIALSEDFSGGNETASFLLGLVKKIWGITEPIEESVDCSW